MSNWDSITEKQKVDVIYAYFHHRGNLGSYINGYGADNELSYNLAKKAFKAVKPSERQKWVASEVYWYYHLGGTSANAQTQAATNRLRNNKVNITRATITKWVRKFPNGCALPEYIWDEYVYNKK